MEDITDRFIKMRKKLGINKSQLASYIQSTPSIIGEIESGKREPSKNILMKLLSKYNVNINWILSGEGEMFIENSTIGIHIKEVVNNQNIETIQHLKVKDTASSETTLSETEEWSGLYSKYLLEDSANENIPKEIDLVKIENVITKPKEMAVLIPEVLSRYKEQLTAIVINGDDMEPTISKSSIVLCNTLGFTGSGIYVIKINDTYMVKRIALKPDYYVISCDNKLYETFEVSVNMANNEKFKIIGLVRCVINILY